MSGQSVMSIVIDYLHMHPRMLVYSTRHFLTLPNQKTRTSKHLKDEKVQTHSNVGSVPEQSSRAHKGYPVYAISG